MRKILFVALHRPARSPSQRFRFEQYLGFIEENGFEYDFSYIISAKDDLYFYQRGQYFKKLSILLKSIFKRMYDVLHANKYDIIFVQREAFMLGTPFFEKKYAAKSKLIFDFDDALWIRQISDASAPNKNLLWLKNPAKTAQIIGCSDMVFAGNRYLANYARQYNKQVKLVPTTIDTDYHRPDTEKKKTCDKICIGWTGSKTTLDHFIKSLPILHKIKEKYHNKVFFKVIGDEHFQYKPLNIQGIRWTSEDEIQQLNTIDIGIMPLPNDEWAKGKCGLKGLQYMALEIPAIMSPVGINKEIIQNGQNGFLPSDEREWINAFDQVIENRLLRKKIGQAGRKTITDRYSVKAWKQRYVDYLNELIAL